MAVTKKTQNATASTSGGEVKRPRRTKAASAQKLPEVAKEEIVAREHLVGREVGDPPGGRGAVGRKAPARNPGSNGDGARERGNGATGVQQAGNPDRASSSPTADEIARRAFEIWQETGCPEGRDLQNWLQAEAELARSSK